ncbi:MAG: stage III sporulation protein AD [Clostridia bacterium]|nr:stage III sporulation protein AD [Clostridia bacterium]
MPLFRIIGVILISAVLSLLIKQHRPELAFAIPVLATSVLLFCIFPYVKEILDTFFLMAEQGGLESRYLVIVIKIIGVAYLCQFAAELCRDVGESSMASKIELAGKVGILTLSMPILGHLLDVVSSIVNF